MGPIARCDSRREVVERLCALLDRAARYGTRFVVFPELALTTFFPRWLFDDEAALDAFFEDTMPNDAVAPLFEQARRLGVGFYLGYAERVQDGSRMLRFNTSILVAPDGQVLGRYRKVHLPGFHEPQPDRSLQHLEKRYFLPGDLGFPVFDAFGGRIGMCICNDRRWPETYRMLALQGAELIALGFFRAAGFSPVTLV